MIKLRDLMNEVTRPKFKNGWDVIEYLDNIPSLSKYRNKNASYDDVYFTIPLNVFTKETELTERDIDRISNSLEPHEGSIMITNGKVIVNGGS